MARGGAPPPKLRRTLSRADKKRRPQGRYEEPGGLEHPAEKARAELPGWVSLSRDRSNKSGGCDWGRGGFDEPAEVGSAKSTLFPEDGRIAAGAKAHGGRRGNVPPGTLARSEFA